MQMQLKPQSDRPIWLNSPLESIRIGRSDHCYNLIQLNSTCGGIVTTDSIVVFCGSPLAKLGNSFFGQKIAGTQQIGMPFGTVIGGPVRNH